MIGRSLFVVTALFGCALLAAGPAAAGNQRPTAPAGTGQTDPAAHVGDRIAELQKQLAQVKKEIEKLHKKKAEAPAAEKATIIVMTLKNASAQDVVRVVREVVPVKGKSLRITHDPRTNSVIVAGDRDTLDTVEAVVTRLEETPAAPPRKK